MITAIKNALEKATGYGELKKIHFIEPERFQIWLRRLSKTDLPCAFTDFHYIGYNATMTGKGSVGLRDMTITIFFMDKPLEPTNDDEIAEICSRMNAEAETVAVSLNQDIKAMSNNDSESGVDTFQVQTVKGFSADKLAGCMVTYNVILSNYFNGICPNP